MTNLKKSLALVVALVMLLGMGTIAAAFSDVPSDYDYVDEISMLSDLGILSGYPDGTFKPEATITRAEACAVVYRMLSGKTLAANFVGATAFSDVAAGNWASGYVNYCTELGVVVGYPDGTFLPNKPVTFAEMSTMIVRALGLDTGSLSYPFGYLAVADMNGVTDNVDLLPNDAAPRGAVAALAYNAIMNATFARIATDDNENPTIAEDVLKLKSIDTTVDGINGYGEGDTDEGEINFDDFDDVVEFDKDSSILGLNVKVWFKGTFSDDHENYVSKCDKVYAVIPKDFKTLTLNMADMSYVDGDIKYDSKKKTVKQDAPLTAYANMTEVDTDYFYDYIVNNAGIRELSNVKFVDNDDDGEYELAFLTYYNVTEVTRVTSSKIYCKESPLNTDLKDSDDELLDVTYPSGLAKDDWVLVYREGDETYSGIDDSFSVATADVDKAVFTAIDESTGTLESINNSGKTNVTIGGADYKLAAIAGTIEESNLGNTFNYYVDDVFGYIVEANTDSGTANVMYIKDAQPITDDWDSTTYKAKVVLADDTSKTLDFEDDDVFFGEDEGEGYNDPGIYTYDLNSDGELTEITQQISYAEAAEDELAGFPKKNGSLLKIGSKNYSIEDDSVVFFIDKDNKVHAYQGSLPAFTADESSETHAFGFVTLNDGTSFVSVEYGIVDVGTGGKLTGASATTDVIGFVTAVKFVTDGDDYAKKYTIAADGAVSDYLTTAESSTTSLGDYKGTAGKFAKFSLGDDGRITDIVLATIGEIGEGDEVEVGYVIGVSGDTYDIRYDSPYAEDLADADYSVYYTLSDDADVYNIDINDKKAAVGIADDILESDIDPDNSYENLYAVYVVVDDDDEDVMTQVFVCTDDGGDTLYD